MLYLHFKMMTVATVLSTGTKVEAGRLVRQLTQ